MSVSSRRGRGRGGVGLVAAAFVAMAFAVTADAAAPVNGLTFAVKVPPAGSASWLFVRLKGTLKPGATLPAHLDLRQLGEVANTAALPKGLAVYAAARLGRSGSTIAIRELLVVLNPRSAGTRTKASAEQERPPAGTVTVKERFSDSALDLFGALLRLQVERSQASEPVLRPTKLLLADEPDVLESPDPLISSTPLSVAGVTLADLGSWEDGHAFGWKVKGSPAGSTNAAEVVNDLDATVTEFIRLVNNPTDYEKAFIEATLEADTARLARDAALPPGSLELAPAASATAPAAATTTGAAAKVVVVDDKASFGGVVCAPGGGSLELSWLIHGAQPGATLVVAMTGPGVRSQVKTTVGANGAASATLPISGSGTWTDTLISVGGKTPSGATRDHAQETCG